MLRLVKEFRTLKKFIAENLGKVIDLSVRYDIVTAKLELINGYYFVSLYSFSLNQVSSFGYLDEAREHAYIVVCS